MREYLSGKDYLIGVEQITGRLNKIISLLELRNSISQARNEMMQGEYVTSPFEHGSCVDEIFNPHNQPIPIPDCTCHKKGQTSAVEYCPLHDKPQEGGTSK